MDKRIDALARKSGNLEHARSLVDTIGEFIAVRGSDGVFAHLFLQAAHGVFGAGNVDFVGNHDARTLRQFIGVHRKLVVDDAVIFHRVAALIAARHVNDMHDECSALDMAQEFMAQALALVSAFDKARNISHDEVVLVALHNAQIRNKRGERIIGDFGARGAHAGDERAFARGRHANERGVGHELHLELDPAFLRGFAQLSERGSAARGGHEMDVAATAMAAFRDDDAPRRHA